MTIAAEFFDVLSSVPATFWGILAGSFFSLSGVVLQNRASESRMRKQFDHERELGNRDRELALKKDVFLDATEAISAAINAVVEFSNLDIHFDQVMTGMRNKQGAIARVQVIGMEDTLRTLAKFTAELNAAIFNLTPRRIVLTQKKQHISILDTQITDALQEQGRWLEMQKQYNLEHKPDQQKWQVITGNFEFVSDILKNTIEQRQVEAGSLLNEQLEFMGQCTEAAFKIVQTLPPLISAARKELGISMSENTVIEVLGAGIEQQRVNIIELQNKIRRIASDQ